MRADVNPASRYSWYGKNAYFCMLISRPEKTIGGTPKPTGAEEVTL